MNFILSILSQKASLYTLKLISSKYRKISHSVDDNYIMIPHFQIELIFRSKIVALDKL